MDQAIAALKSIVVTNILKFWTSSRYQIFYGLNIELDMSMLFTSRTAANVPLITPYYFRVSCELVHARSYPTQAIFLPKSAALIAQPMYSAPALASVPKAALSSKLPRLPQFLGCLLRKAPTAPR